MNEINLINFLNSIFGAPFWKGIAAIATASMVFLTYRTLQRMKKERKIQINREIIERIYNILFQDLETILNLRRIENLESIYPSNWKWEEIKSKESWLAYQIPDDLFNELNKLSWRMKEYEKIRTSFREEFEEFLTKIVQDREILTKENPKKIENLTYWEGIGLDHKGVSIFDLFFWDKDLREFLNQEELKGEFLLDFFDVQGLRKRKKLTGEEFNKILKIMVKNREYIFQYKHLSQEIFNKIKDFYNETKDLKEKIEKKIQELAKEKL